jgi:hypothetical protein
MIKLAKNNNDGTIDIFAGTDTEWALAQGFSEMDVEIFEGIPMLAEDYNRLVSSEAYLAQKLAEIKQKKLEENRQKREEKLLGGVTYKNVLFDSDIEQKVNLMFTLRAMKDTDTIVWLGKDNEPLECTKTDLEEIGSLIAQLTAEIWSVLNPGYIKAIQEAKSVEEVEAIEINYDNP